MNLGTQRPRTIPGGQEYNLPPVAAVGEGMADRPAPGAGHAIRVLMRESRENNQFSPRLFRHRWRQMLGLKDVANSRGQYRTTYDPAAQKIGYEEIPIREVARELLPVDVSTTELREALAPITASTQQDINAYSIYIGGLVELKFKEGYELPDFIGKTLVFREPTAVRQQRIIGEANMNLPDGPTLEANEYPNQGLQPRWVIRPPVIKYGQKASMTTEARIFGLGGELLAGVQGGGKSLGYLEDYLIAAMIHGTNIPVGTPGFMTGYNVNSFLYNAQPNDTPNVTYQAAVGTGASAKYNYQNLYAASPLTDWRSLQTARFNLSLMREYETGFPLLGTMNNILVGVGAHDNAEVICHSKQVFSTNALTAGTPGSLNWASNPAGNAAIQIYSSPTFDKQLMDTGVSATNSVFNWWAGDFRKAFGWASVWDTRIIQANQLSSALVGADIEGEWVYSWFGVPYVRDPHFVLEMTN